MSTATLVSASPSTSVVFQPTLGLPAAPESLPDDFLMREGADPTSLGKLLASVDNTSLLFAVQIMNRDGQIELGKEGVELKKEEVEHLFAKIHAAIDEAMKAAEKGGFFGALFDKFGVIAKVAVAVAAVASVVATGGASLVAIAALAGTLLSSFSGQLARVFHGGELLEKIFRYGGMGLSLVAGGAGIVQGVAGGVQTTVNSGAWSTVTQVAISVQAGATAGQAVTGYVRDRAEADALSAHADETEARADRAAALRQMQELVDFIKEVQHSFNKANDTLRSAVENMYASDKTLSTMGVRA